MKSAQYFIDLSRLIGADPQRAGNRGKARTPPPSSEPRTPPPLAPSLGRTVPQSTCTPPSLSPAVVGDTELRQKTWLIHCWAVGPSCVSDQPLWASVIQSPGVATLTPAGIPGFLKSVYGFCISSHLWGASPFLLSSGERKQVVQKLGGRRPCGAFGELGGQATGTCLWKNDGWWCLRKIWCLILEDVGYPEWFSIFPLKALPPF